MASRLDAAQQFLALKRVAFVGLSQDPKDFSRAVFRALAAAGHEWVPVHPSAQEIEGRRCFARLTEVTPPVEGAFLMVSPAHAGAVVQDAIAAGVKNLWFHRGGGAGVSTPELLAQCREKGITVVDGLCPFMALPRANWVHRLHGYFRRRSLDRQDREVKLLTPGQSG